jgi:hypothetical protein
VGQNDAFKRNGRQPLGAVVVAFLSRGQQRMQHLDRRFEHFDEFHQPTIGAAQGAGEAVGVRVVLGEMLQFADIHLADQRGDVLIVFVARFGFGDGDLMQDRRPQLHHPEFGDVAVVFLQRLAAHGDMMCAGNGSGCRNLLPGSGHPHRVEQPSGDSNTGDPSMA